MVNKKLTYIILTLLFAILYTAYPDDEVAPIPIEKNEEGFLFKYEGKEALFIQKIFWDKSEYAISYQMLLKDNEDRMIIDVETEDNFREFSLPAGEYFYKIIPFNILGQAEGESRWIPLSIKKAYLPVIYSLSIETIYVEDFYNDPIVIHGKDFTDEVTVHLKDLTDPLRHLITPVIKEKSNSKIELQFKKEDFSFGEYELIVTNPGNIYAIRKINVKFAKPVDIFSTTSYLPIINSQSGNFNSLLSDIFHPFGIRLEFVLFPIKLKYGYIGFGLNGDFNFFNEIQAVTLDGLLFKGSVSANYLYYFNKYFGIHPKFGGGVAFTGMIFNYGNDAINKKYLSADPYFITGAGIQLRVFRGITLYTGFDYIQLFYSDSTFGFFQPYLGAGYYF